ncbi:hypothetical protein C0J52_05182 [Blattella germanica]|nr:hypothetical protein C0J52_05182 [Blattella germanica]
MQYLCTVLFKNTGCLFIIGDWKRDLRHGYGAYFYQNGDIYEGTWKKGQRHGLGTYLYALYADSGTKFMGTWENGKMQGPGQIVHPRHRFHGSWEKNLPKDAGVYTFNLKLMQHGSYIHMQNPEFDFVGEGGPEETSPEQIGEEQEDSVMKGIVPIWRVQRITRYDPELMPPEPKPIPITDSVESVIEEEEEEHLSVEEEEKDEGEGGKIPILIGYGECKTEVEKPEGEDGVEEEEQEERKEGIGDELAEGSLGGGEVKGEHQEENINEFEEGNLQTEEEGK